MGPCNWTSGSWFDQFLPRSKVLDIYAAIACVEHLEPTQLETDGQRQAWLRQVKKLQVPIELICSQDSVRHYGDRGKTMVCIVR